MRLVVCGGSFWTPRVQVFRALDFVADEIEIRGVVVPLQYGIDKWATRWGNSRRVTVIQVAIPSIPHHRGRAVHLRDDRLFSYQPGALLAFGRGSGATRLIRRAQDSGIPVCVWDEHASCGAWDEQGLVLLRQLEQEP